MKFPKGSSFTSKRARSPEKLDDDRVTGVTRSLQRQAKFKSPLTLNCAHALQSDFSGQSPARERCDSTMPLRAFENETASNSCDRFEHQRIDFKNRVFGTDTSNLQHSINNATNADLTERKSKRPCINQTNNMPNFCRIVDDANNFCPQFDVTAELADSDDQRMYTSNHSARNRRERGGGGIKTEPDAESTEGDQAKMETDKLAENVGPKSVSLEIRNSGASRKGLAYSKFKMPVRVASNALASSPFHSSGRSSTASVYSANNNDNRGKAEDKRQASYYSVMYCNWKPYAKHKGPWSDGVIIRRGRTACVLQDTEGKMICNNGDPRAGDLSEGATFVMGRFEVEVMRISSEQEFLSGSIFLGGVELQSGPVAQVIQKPIFKFTKFKIPTMEPAGVSTEENGITPCVVPAPEDVPVLEKDALVLNTADHRASVVPVVVDPFLALKLRPHQKEGVKFMYECVLGLRNSSFTGCLLADAMGLGKTLQVIALIWTLIKQGPGGHPAVRRVLVICPSSLVENWGKEVRKWLGNERLCPLIVHSGTAPKEVKRKLLSFQHGRTYNLLITSYELLRKHKDDLNSANPGLLVCDEAHRLKNCAGNKTIHALAGVNCSKRLILTGTPIQNDLMEFYAMIDFVNPNLLGPISAFKRLYAKPIEKSRDRDATEAEKLLGSARSAELQLKTRFCILQRSAEINSNYLPSKTEFVVFCRLQPLQTALYEGFLRSKLVSESLKTGQSHVVLSAIGTLRKLCNHPRLVEREVNKAGNDSSAGNEEVLKISSRHGNISADWMLSGKLVCLHNLLISIVHKSSSYESREKMVVVSNFTQTLDIIQSLCEGQGWSWLRLDGSTDVAERQRLVDRFNANDSKEIVFLLSSKAGGSGLNLIGANRLVLFDPDWNPATDAQAMARIWRDGQTKPVYIYRLLTTASIEEKIYQRQIMKGEVAAAVEDQSDRQFAGGGGRRHFSREELRELFTLCLETSCDTYDLLSQSQSSHSDSWRDYSKEVEDHALKAAILSGVVTFVYQNIYKKGNKASVTKVPDNVGEIIELEEVAGQDENSESSCPDDEDTELEDVTGCDEDSKCPSAYCIDERAEEFEAENAGQDEDKKYSGTHFTNDAVVNFVPMGGTGPDGNHVDVSWVTSALAMDDIDELLLEYEFPNETGNEDQSLTELEDARLLVKEVNSSENGPRSTSEAFDLKGNVDEPDANPADLSPAPGHVTKDVFECLLESNSQNVLKQLVDLHSPDEFDVDNLEDLDEPFLCSLDLEMELQRASFTSEDLWQGFKVFAIGFLYGVREQRLSYRNSKLGMVLDKCNLDKTSDDERIFCKGLPLVQAVIGRRHGHDTANILYLFNCYERKGDLQTTSSGRFMLNLMNRFEEMKASSAESDLAV